MAEDNFEQLKQWYEAIQNATPNTDGTYTVEGKKVSAAKYKEYKKSSKLVYDDAVNARKDVQSKAETKAKDKAEAKAKADSDAKAKAKAVIQTAKDNKSKLDRLQRENQVDALILAGKKIPQELMQTWSQMGSPRTADSSAIALRNNEISKIPVSSTTTVAPTATTPELPPLRPVATVPATPSKTSAPTKYTNVRQAEAAITPAEAAINPAVVTANNSTNPVTSTKTSTKTSTTGTPVTTVVNGKKVVEGTNGWQKIVQQEFGSLWDVYNDNADVKKVLDKSVQEGWYNDTVKLTAELQNTNWFRATQSSARRYAIRQSTDPATLQDDINKEIEQIRAESLVSGVTLSDTTLKDLAEKKTKFGWTAQQVSNAVGSEAVAAATTGGAQGITDLRQGALGTRLRGVADNFAQKPTNSMLDMYIAEIMQGTKSEQGFNDLMKQQASTQYRSLAPQIDKGLDVKTAVSMYSNSAQSVLGVDSATIDWSTDKWNKALNYQDPKTNEYRQMDSWEWNRYLRGLPEWQETDDAKRTYRSAAFTLAQAFGKTT